MGEQQRPAGHQLHQVAVMLAGMVERLADTVSGPLRADALSGLEAARHIIDAHESPMPDLVELARELRNMLYHLEAKVQVRGTELADQQIAAVQAAATEKYEDLLRSYESYRNRGEDLEAEMRRQFFQVERGRAVYGNALVDALEGLEAARGAGTLDQMLGAVDRTITAIRGKAPARRMPVPEKRELTVRERRNANA